MHLLHTAALAATLLAAPAAAQCQSSCQQTTTRVASWPAKIDAAEKDIVETALAAGDFETLAAALGAADLVGALQGEGPFTVFAPTDDAFAKLGEDTLAELLKPENRAKLASILTFHVASGSLDAAAVTKRRTVDTLNGQRIDLAKTKDGLTVDGAGLVATDVRCSNGIIHVIDTVLLPETDGIVETAKAAGNFGTLLTAVKTAGLVDTLMGEGPFTVFAPTDDAFAKLGKDAVASLLKPENRETLTKILTYHVVSGRVFADQAIAAKSAKTLEGSALAITADGSKVRIDEANVVSADLDLANGVIHVIDSVLVPDTVQLGSPRIGVYLEAPSRDLADYLGIDRHASLMVTSTTAAGGARHAGVLARDIIVAVDGHPATHENLDRAKRSCRCGQPVELAILRRGERLHLHVPVRYSL